MPLICYKPQNFSEDKLKLIASANLVIDSYQQKGFSLTLRQIYYVFVSNDLFPDGWMYSNAGGNKWVLDLANGTKNAPPNYDKLGDLISDARMAGLVDWYAIEDRSRSSYANQHWQRPSQILEGTVNTYATDKWTEQPNYVEVWVEKEALQNVLQRACSPLDVRFFACKGYTSQTAMWEASQRLLLQASNGKNVHIIHLGDHDPSGVDMTRDIEERLDTFISHNDSGHSIEVHRIALNMDQVREYNPPPNPAKILDPRAKRYIAKYGDESWELDALRPELLVGLISNKIRSFRDQALWDAAVKNEERGRSTLECICKYFPDVVGFLRERRKRDDSAVICNGCGATVNNPVCRCVDATDGPAMQLGPGGNG